MRRPLDCAHPTVTHRARAAQRAEEEDKLAGGTQTRRDETTNKMEELQACAPNPPCPPLCRTVPRLFLLTPGRWADKKVTLPPTFTKSMLDAKMKSIGLGQQVNAPLATAHELLSRCSGGKGLSGVVPTSRTPQPALTRLF